MDERAAELYGLPLEEFTKARNELARELAEAGDKDASTAVKALKKPSLAAWAINQLARSSRSELERLRELRNRMREAGLVEELRAATEERGRLVARMVERARDELVRGGHSPSASTLHKVSESLLGAGTDDELAELLEGRLERELESTGFDDAFRLKGIRPAPPGEPRTEIRKAEVQKLREEVREAEQELRRATSAAEAAERAARRAIDEAGRARLHLEKTRRRYEDAQQQDRPSGKRD